MNDVTIRFYGELNDFLQPGQKQMAFRHCFYGQPSVKDLIESLGVPHTEVDLLLIDGESASFGHHLQGGERVAAYPFFKHLDIPGLTRVWLDALTHYRFILDVHLGKLALYLRMMGFDTLYQNDASDDHLAAISAAEKRILLTFDRSLLKRKKVTYGYGVRSLMPSAQLLEVLRRFDLFDRISPFQRCLRCNAGKVYWKESHYDHMQGFIEKVRAISTRED